MDKEAQEQYLKKLKSKETTQEKASVEA